MRYTQEELSAMTIPEIREAMKAIGNLYTAMAIEIRTKRFLEEVGKALTDHEPGCPALGGYGTPDTTCICD